MAKTKSMRMLYAEHWLVSAGKCGTRDTTHTIPALLEIVLYAFGNANVESVSESIDLIAADLTPFEQHLKPHHDQHMSRARQDVFEDVRTFTRLYPLIVTMQNHKIPCCHGTPFVNFSNVTANAVFERL